MTPWERIFRTASQLLDRIHTRWDGLAAPGRRIGRWMVRTTDRLNELAQRNAAPRPRVEHRYEYPPVIISPHVPPGKAYLLDLGHLEPSFEPNLPKLLLPDDPQRPAPDTSSEAWMRSTRSVEHGRVVWNNRVMSFSTASTYVSPWRWVPLTHRADIWPRFRLTNLVPV